MYSLNINSISKSSVNELILYYKRQKLELREDGTQLIRAIARPDYMINNDEIQILDTLGKVCSMIRFYFSYTGCVMI